MTMYLGTDNQGTLASSLQDFEPTGMQKMDAAVREAWMESYGPTAVDFWRTQVGGATDTDQRITAAEAQDYVNQSGHGLRMNITPKDGQYTRNQWRALVDRQREMAAIKDVRERTPWELSSVARGVAMFGAGIVDPINLATAFVPWTRLISTLKSVAITAETGASLAGRTAARAVIGAADAGISTAVIEPFYYGARQVLGDDYTAYDSMANIAFGAAFGGGVHTIGGAVGDLLRRRAQTVPMATEISPEVTAAAMDMTPAQRAEVGIAPESARAGMPEIVEPVGRGADEAPVVAERSGSIAARIVERNDGAYLMAESPVGRVGGVVDGQTLRINFAEVDEAFRGRGFGVALYERLINDAMDRGLAVTSDSTVEKSAARVYQALEKRGFIVRRTEGGGELPASEDLPDGALFGKDSTEPVFVVERGPGYVAPQPTAATTAATIEPETREAALRASVAQAVSGREIDVDAIVGMDPSLRTSTVDDAIARADANFAPEAVQTADFAAAADVQRRVDTAPKWQTLKDAEAADAEAMALLDDTVKAGDEAFKYSREQAPSVKSAGSIEELRASWDAKGIRHAILESRGTITLSQIIVPDDGRNAGVGTEAMRELVAYADRTGQRVALTPSSDFGGNKSRLVKFYKRFGFVENKGRNKDYTTMEAMYREARPVDASAPLYARGITGQSAVDTLTVSIRSSFGDSTEVLMARGQIQIVATPKDIPGGPHPADVKAATAPDGTVYVVAENVSEAEARGIVLHEVGVHVGMQEMLGPEVFNDVLRQLDDAIALGESWAQAARSAVPADTLPAHVREEQLAYLVQNAPELPLVQRIIAAVRAWAYRTFEAARERMTLTEADFRAMAVSSLRQVAREGAPVGQVAPAFSRDVAQTETKAFRDWFGDSKVVGPDGEPLVVYHGTMSGGFTEFQASSTGTYGDGIYLSTDEDVAGFWAGDRSADGIEDEAGGSIYPVYVSIRNPASGDLASEMESIHGSNTSKVLQEMGYDGILAEDGEIVAFRPEQIKSAIGNRGTFDPTNPDIRYSRGETPDPSTAKNELQPYDDAVARAKQYASVLRAAADKLDNDAQATAAMRAALPDITAGEITMLLSGLRKQVEGLRGVARSARDAVMAEDNAAAMQFDAMQAADELANNLQMAAVIEKRNAALNINARMKAASFVGQFRKPGLDFEGFRALLVGTERRRVGGRLSVESEQKQFRGAWVGGMIADLEKAGLWRQFISGDFDRDIYAALYNLGRDGAGNENLPPEAVRIAEVVNKYQTDARNTRNRFGAWIRDLQGYITRQTHDMFKIRDAGEQAWVNDTLPRIDMQKMVKLGLISETDPVGSLRMMYDDFAAGTHMKAPTDESDVVAFSGSGRNLARKESASRTLYFKDGIAAYEYNAKYGAGRLSDTVLHGLESAAKSAGLLKVLGTNPEATVTRLFDEYAESLRGDPARRADFLAKRKELENLLKHVDGTANIPGSADAAKIAANTRALVSMAKLGGALISSITDLSNYAAEMRFGQDRSLLGGVLDSIGSVVRGRAKGEKKQILSALGVFHESSLGAVYSRFDNPDLIGGKMAWGMQQFFKWNGLNWWTESLRDGYALSHSHYLAQNAGKQFDQLPEALRDMLRLYNIDAGKWEILRVAPLQQADGRMYMTPDGLRTVPIEKLEEYIRSTGRTVNDATILNLQADLAGALRAMTIDRMHHAVIEPGARTRAFMQRGTQPGTVPGELLRFVGQFKSFPVALIQMTLGREVYGRGYDTLGDYLRKGHGDMLGLASFIALSTAMGYAAMSIKDLIRGKNPRPLDNPNTWAAAFIQGGGLGIYGDFLFGKYNRMGSTVTGTLAGPVAGVLDTVADLWTRVRTGDDVAAAAFKAALDNTPFMNLFYTRAVLDYLILYQVQDALNPGFLRRMERRAQTEFGQTYWLPPSQVTR